LQFFPSALTVQKCKTRAREGAHLQRWPAERAQRRALGRPACHIIDEQKARVGKATQWEK